ncbi:MAG: S46 family peptidase, partial [Melioribacteraceae bacterium]|nr:S46 family peptidase [Melioribacteraceae bacterium]
ETSRIVAIDDEFGNDISKDELTEFVNSELLTSQIISKEYFDDLLEMSFEEIKDLDDPLIQFSLKLKEQYDALKDEKERMDGALSKLSPQLSEVKRVQQETLFIPDANSTLRLTYGYIKGYTPADAIYYSPITSLDGIIDKSYAGGDYQIPAKLRELYKNKDFGQFYNKKLKSIPVGLLYNMDTTGGNSGSPILDAYGNLVGVNFDRAFEATINDYAWNESYSRSIGVDIRYILWITQKLGGADFLLQEMGVEVK